MNPEFHKLVKEQVKASTIFGKDSKENREALALTKAWQDSCVHIFTKRSKAGTMCEHCNFPRAK